MSYACHVQCNLSFLERGCFEEELFVARFDISSSRSKIILGRSNGGGDPDTSDDSIHGDDENEGDVESRKGYMLQRVSSKVDKFEIPKLPDDASCFDD